MIQSLADLTVDGALSVLYAGIAAAVLFGCAVGLLGVLIRAATGTGDR